MTEPQGDTPGPIAGDGEPDYEIDRSAPNRADPFLPQAERRPVGLWLAGAAVIVALIIGVWMAVGRRPADPAPQESRVETPAAPEAAPTTPLGAPALDRDIPPLDESDIVVRELVRQLSSHPTVAAWLATDGLLRSFTVSIVNIGNGITPVRQLATLRSASPFAVIPQGEALVVDPASYRRYDAIAGAAASISADGAARLYGTLKPRLAEAYAELGEPADVDRAVERAIVQLLRTPVVESPVQVAVAPRGIGYVYSDARLEALTPPQKQLLRMGPANVRTIQRALRDIALELGIPAGRLPPPSR